MNKRGFALIALIILIVVIGLLVYPTTMYIRQSLKLNVERAQEFQAYAASQAGLMDAAYDMLQNGNYGTIEANLANRQNYKQGYSGAGTNLYLNARLSTSSGNTITNWHILNPSTTEAYTIKYFTVAWTQSSSRTMTTLAINGATVWTGSISSGAGKIALATLATIPASSIIKTNTITFNNTSSVITTLDMTFETTAGATFFERLDPPNEPDYPNPPPTYPSTNRVSKWSMNENTGATVNDSFGTNTGTSSINPAVWTTGKFSYGITFGGSNNRVVVADNNTLDLTNGGTVGAWIYPTTLTASSGIVHKGISTGLADEAYGLTIGTTNTTILFYFVNTSGTTRSMQTAASTIPTANTWYFVVGTWSTAAVNGKVSVYVNGELIGTPTTVAAIESARNSATALLIGSKFSSGNQAQNLIFPGKIDESFIFNRALTSDEVKSLYLGTVDAQLINHPTLIKSTGKYIDTSLAVMSRQTMLATFDVIGGVMKVSKYGETTNHLLP